MRPYRPSIVWPKDWDNLLMPASIKPLILCLKAIPSEVSVMEDSNPLISSKLLWIKWWNCICVRVCVATFLWLVKCSMHLYNYYLNQLHQPPWKEGLIQSINWRTFLIKTIDPEYSSLRSLLKELLLGSYFFFLLINFKRDHSAIIYH